MSGQWRTAKFEDRNTILECLEARNYRTYPSGTRYLNAKGLREGPLIEVLIENLKQYEIFELPRQNRRSPQKYQFVIRHEDPELLIYVKMNPGVGDPPILMLDFHSHNTGYQPLPLLPIRSNEKEPEDS